jgi:hypothetical protein
MIESDNTSKHNKNDDEKGFWRTCYEKRHLIGSVTIICVFMLQLAYGLYFLESLYEKAFAAIVFGVGSIAIGWNYWKHGDQ